MGKVTEKLTKIRTMTNMELIRRFIHIANAQSLKIYLAQAQDKNLDIEVRFCEEELLERLSNKIIEKIL